MNWKLAGQIAAILLVALVLTAAPAGDATLNVALTLLSIAFFTALGVMGYRMFRQYRTEFESLEDRTRLVLYGCVGAIILTLVATNRMFDAGGLFALLWIALLALCSYGLYWVWMQYRSDRAY